MTRDPQCVFETSDPDLANVILARLASEGVKAQVLDRRTEGNLFGASLMSGTGGHSGGVQVWVADPQQRQQANEILADHQTHSASSAAAPVSVVCSECGTTDVFSADQKGTVQECPECGEYLDVPDPEHAGELDAMAAEALESEEERPA